MHPFSRRTTTAILALGVPVVALLVVLGVRGAAGSAPGTDALQVRVSAVADGIAASGAGDGFVAGGATGGPGRPMSGGSSEASNPGRSSDLAVVCLAVDGSPARLTVTVDGEVVQDREVPCADGSDPDADPAVTNTPDVALSGAWSFEVAGASEAAVAVVVTPV